MISPTKEKTWLFSNNNNVNTGVAIADEAAMLFGLKSFLVSNGWTVSLSNNRTSYGAADYWASVADISPHPSSNNYGSWIVLKNPALAGGNLEILIAYYGYVSGSSNQVRVYASSSGFSGGSLTTVPTATIMLGIYVASKAGSFRYSTANKYYHMQVSSDGECFRFFVTEAGYCVTLLAVEKMKNPPGNINSLDNWHVTYVYGGYAAAADRVLAAYLCDASTYSGGVYTPGSVVLDHYLTCTCCADEPLVDLIAAYHPEESATKSVWPAFPVGVAGYHASYTPQYKYCPRGELYDIYWGASSISTGSTYSTSGDRSWVKMGILWLPWDGSVPMTS